MVAAAVAGAVAAHLYWPGFTATASQGPPARVNDTPKPGRVAISPAQIAAQDISTVSLEIGTIDRHITVPGTITTDAARVARVPARVMGIVAEMRKLLGGDVKAGEIVSVLDSREVADAKSDYLEAMVKAGLQRTIFERQQRLLDIKAIATAQLDQTRASLQEAQLRADLARQKLSALGLDAAEVAAAAKRDERTPNQSSLRRYELRAPIAGRVVERKVDVGVAVGKEGEPADLYTIADLSALWVELAVPIAELPAIREGAKVTVASGGVEPRWGEARVVFVSPLLNPETRTARVIATLPNPDFIWRPGSFVSAEVAMQPRPACVLVPRAAVQRLDGETKVFVRVADGFEARKVHLGLGDDKFWEVAYGVEKGDRVAVANSFLLKAELGKTDLDGD